MMRNDEDDGMEIGTKDGMGWGVLGLPTTNVLAPLVCPFSLPLSPFSPRRVEIPAGELLLLGCVCLSL